MKIFAALGAVVLFLLLIASVPHLQAQEHENEGNGAKSEQQQDESRQPSARPEEDRRGDQSTQPPRANQPGQERSDQEQPRQPQAAPPQQGERTPAQNERRSDEAQRGKRITDDRFRASFGPRHKFRLRRVEVVNNSRPVITHGGYSFELLEPWPAAWSFEDDCYIDYVDEQYYLFDPFHPAKRIALMVVNVD